MYPSAVPDDVAVLVRHRLHNMHCDVTVFFSPALAELAQQFGAHKCYQPARDEVELLVGSARALA